MAKKAAGLVFPPWPLVEYVACVAWKCDQVQTRGVSSASDENHGENISRAK